MFKVASWKKGKKTITGIWKYNWQKNKFTIILDSKNRITGTNIKVETFGDTPEWNGWKLVKD